MDIQTAESILRNLPGYEEQHKRWKAGDQELKKQIEQAYTQTFPGYKDLSNFLEES